MALFKELRGRSVGSVRGLNSTAEYVLIRVVAENHEIVKTDNGWIWPDPRGLVQAQPQWSPGAGHPFDGTKRASQYIIVEDRAPGQAVVKVNYTRQNTVATPPTDDWLIQVRTATIQQRITRELPAEPEGRFKGGGPREPVLSSSGIPLADDFWTREARAIGMPQYVPMDDRCVDADGQPLADDDLTFRYQSVDPCGKREWKKLRRIADHTDGSGGMFDVPALDITWTRTVPNFHVSMAPTMARYNKSINVDPFEGALLYHVLVRDIQVTPIAHEMQGQRTPGQSWRVSVSVLWSDFPFVPDERVSVYPKDQFQATVYELENDPRTNKPKPVLEQFRVKRREELFKLLPLLARGR